MIDKIPSIQRCGLEPRLLKRVCRGSIGIYGGSIRVIQRFYTGICMV